MDLISADTGLVIMDLLPHLGPTPVSVDCYHALVTGWERWQIKHALETMVVLGRARVESTAWGDLYAKPEEV